MKPRSGGGFCCPAARLVPGRAFRYLKPMTATERAPIIFARLRAAHPRTPSALDWADAWQLLAATVLAAQCTDARVNLVTPELFRRWPDPASQALADLA
jgi:endonuclease III